MTAIVIGLIVMQLLSFYFIILLNSKISKFKDLEVRQDQLIREMDDTISLYLVEMKQENDRFLEQLSKVKAAPAQTKISQPVMQDQPQAEDVKTETAVQKEQVAEEVRSYVPKNIAKQVYGQHVKMTAQPQQPNVQPKQKVLAPFEQQVVELHRAGMPVEDIAKKMQKGKTEIELLLKFHA